MRLWLFSNFRLAQMHDFNNESWLVSSFTRKGVKWNRLTKTILSPTMICYWPTPRCIWATNSTQVAFLPQTPWYAFWQLEGYTGNFSQNMNWRIEMSKNWNQHIGDDQRVYGMQSTWAQSLEAVTLQIAIRWKHIGVITRNRRRATSVKQWRGSGLKRSLARSIQTVNARLRSSRRSKPQDDPRQ